MNSTIHINASRPYDAVIGKGILGEIGQALSQRFGYSKVAIFTDDTVDALYAATVSASLQQARIGSVKFVFRHGEAAKTLATAGEFIDAMAGAGITRTDAVLALGGGVAGDIGGLAAALYMRGIDFVQVPTTLLAMVDSSVGGKTAVDISAGKNMLGAFHQPSLVWCDVSTLDTLPQSILRDGYAEVIKYGVLFDSEFFDTLKFGEALQQTVGMSIRFKRDIVQQDELDRGQRALLNLGHTIGHAVERLSGYAVTHGTAVAVGMSRAARLGAAFGLQDCTQAIDSKLAGFGFTTDCPYSAQELFDAAMSDKKRSAGHITLVLPERIGKCGLYKIDTESFRKLLVTAEQWN